MSFISTMNCPDCGAGKEPGVMCGYALCPGTVQIRWDAAVDAERRLIADLEADDGNGLIGSRVSAVEFAFRQVQHAGVPRDVIRAKPRNQTGLGAAHRAWLERRSEIANRALKAQRAIQCAKLADVRERYRQDQRLSLDDFRVLVRYAYDSYEGEEWPSEDWLLSAIEGTLTA